MIVDLIKEYNISLPDAHGDFATVSDLVNFVKPLTDIEGIIIDFYGHKLKCKADKYVLIHKTKDLIRTDKNIAEIILSETMDDLIPILDVSDVNRIRNYEIRFEKALNNAHHRILAHMTKIEKEYGNDKKRVAIEYIPTIPVKEDSSLIFSAMDGKDIRDLIIKRMKASLSSNVKYECAIAWLEA